MLTVHHLGKSQSERIVWLCEELGLDYDLKHHVRDARTMLSPPALRALHPIGSAPVITEGAMVLAEIRCLRGVHPRPAWRRPAGSDAGPSRLSRLPLLAARGQRIPAAGDGAGGC
ncbi:glutathione S-transferase N-terminal domain-containing protein [Dankookia sp. P2]|uniref:glutathione S-transferase N-terminal domain-containing protein n=1 Tax=Dankookia sp. P2 TaxID=3423955 RepID=UPI003D664454